MVRSAVIVIAVALVGCKSEREKLVDAHGTQLKAQLAKLAALAPVAAKQPAVACDGGTWPPPGVKGVAFDYRGTGAVVFEHQLAHTCEEPWTTFDGDHVSGRDFIILSNFDTDWLNNAACSVAGKNPHLVDFSEQYLGESDVTRLEALKYVLVLRLREVVVPGFGSDDKTFAPGRLAGDGLLYELASAKLVGSFPFDVTNPDTLEFRGKGYEVGDQARLQLGKVLSDEIAKRADAVPK